jgi:hypothetical protein
MYSLPTVGSSFSKDEKTAIRGIKLKYILAGIGDDFATLDTWLPDTAPLGLPLTNRTATKRDDGDWDLELGFEGIPEDQITKATTEKERIELDLASAEDPIESFKDFAALRKKYGGTLTEGNAGSVIWPEKIKGDDGTQIQNKLFGTSHYLNPGAVLRITRVVLSFDPAVLRNMGKIDFPDINDAQWELIKDLPDDRNWLKKSVRTNIRGNVIELTLEWLLSGPGGYITDIYGPKV